ncbi:MAG: hypothetical protein QMD99_07175 [Rhizobiaceae bacterium]|nr:hypothetical protein [Rhizobiaceae bacterium]
MTAGPRIILNIDRLRVHGVCAGDAAALTEGLRTALVAQLGANAGALTGQGGTDHLRLTVPQHAGHGPAALGRLAGHKIAAALTRPKGGG